MNTVVLFILFVVLIFLLFLICRVKLMASFTCHRIKYSSITGGESNRYIYTRYPKFCCDSDPIPLTLDQYNTLLERENLDNDTKFLYKVLHDSNIRVVVEFDTSNFKDKSLYTKKFTNISEKHGRNIYYQIAVMNDYSVHDYPKKNKYDINVYFITNDTQKSKLYTKNYYNTVVASKLFLNKNSIEFLKYQDLDRFNSFQMKDSRISFNTYLNFLNSNVDLYDQEKIVGIHGILAYSLGLRKMKDIDVFVNNDEILTNKILAFGEDDVFNITKFGNLDDNIKLFNSRIEYLIKSTDIEELFTDSKNYLYFLGMKYISLDHNMQLRYLRQRPRAVGEIIAFNLKNPEKKYPIPSIPQYKYQLPPSLSSIIAYDMENEYSFLHKVLNIDIKPELLDSNKFLGTLLFYLKTVYNIHKFKDIEELKKYYNKHSG